jgi:hypothetical protein
MIAITTSATESQNVHADGVCSGMIVLPSHDKRSSPAIYSPFSGNKLRRFRSHQFRQWRGLDSRGRPTIERPQRVESITNVTTIGGADTAKTSSEQNNEKPIRPAK